ncbi:helix-turn-helix domain-containing protein [Saccharothrix longispora]|uniref:Transcriptional regulator with XRE-family HTH domain n=1 Tax=Saccharothrix longispora TaxID=33920 RepID=A0ABU1Q102_9PSEU|nr:helix-turn-helix transcriptional regulator [Saccharothrix longispora]MDR6596577.1 transcriptional regulator with XRE-family HTH domain [Saccharothrix longispora]
MATTAKQRRLARRLRQLRTRAGRTVEDAAAELGCKHPKISKIETSLAGVKPEEVRLLCRLYGAGDHTTESMVALARNAKTRGWYLGYHGVANPENIDFAELETDAVSVGNFEIDLVPGLLQTQDYSRAVFRTGLPRISDDDVEHRAELRATRQQRVSNGALSVWAIVTEATLVRAVGGRDVHSAQLARLVELAALPNVQFQVVPTRAGEHVSMGVPFSCFTFDDGSGAVAVDHLTGTLFLEEDVDVERYRLAFQHLCGTALSPQDSLALLRQYIEEGHSSWKPRS